MNAAAVAEVRTVIRMEGTFDVSAARRLARDLDAMVFADVRIDLTRVREFHDFGVALLASSIASRRAPTSVIGLQEHHLRLLKYLGIDCGVANLTAGVELV
jgi:ABC-type transporter Mla MlaB component